MLQSRSEKLWVAAGVGVALLLAVVAYFFLIGPQLAQASSLNSQNDGATTQNAVLQQRVDQLRAEQPDLARYESTLKSDQAALPAQNGMADFLRSMQAVGLSTQVEVTSITVGAAASGSSAAAPLAGGVQSLPITLAATGTDQHLREFLTQLQTVQPRAVVVSQATLASGKTAGTATIQLSMTAFVQPRSR